MKLLFFYDNKFWRFNGQVYSYGHFAYELLWMRYLKYFDEIRVAGRFFEGTAEDVKGMSVSSGDHVSFFEIPNTSTLKGLTQLGEVRKIAKRELADCDYAIFRLPGGVPSIGCSEAQKMGKNYAVEVVTCAHDSLTNYNWKGKLIAPFEVYLEKKYVKSAPNALYVSRHFLQERYPNDHFNIGCPDCNVPLTDDSVLRQRLMKIDAMDVSKEIRVGLIASLKVGYKGHDTAIKAASYLIKKYPNIKICFLGDGEPDRWRTMAQKYGVAENIEFCGSLPGGEPVLKWIDNLDVFIMPSLQETLGRALVEAMSRGCPAIGGAGTAVPEQLPDDCIHERKNAKQLAEMIDYMLAHKSYMKLCAEENFVRAKKYSEEILNEKRDYFWNRAIGNVQK